MSDDIEQSILNFVYHNIFYLLYYNHIHRIYTLLHYLILFYFQKFPKCHILWHFYVLLSINVYYNYIFYSCYNHIFLQQKFWLLFDIFIFPKIYIIWK